MNKFLYEYGNPDTHFNSKKVGSYVMAGNKNLSKDHINHILQTGYSTDINKVMSRNDLDEDQIHNLIHHGSGERDILNMVAGQKNLSIENANHILSQSPHTSIPLHYNKHLADKYKATGVIPSHIVKLKDMRHMDIPPQEKEHMVKHGDDVVWSALANNKLEPHHIDHILSRSSSQSVLDGLSSRENLTDEHISKLIDKGDLDNAITLASYQKLKPHHKEQMISKFGQEAADVLSFHSDKL